jgi:hypothetical protein
MLIISIQFNTQNKYTELHKNVVNSFELRMCIQYTSDFSALGLMGIGLGSKTEYPKKF